jgi:hypothetical protein
MAGHSLSRTGYFADPREIPRVAASIMRPSGSHGAAPRAPAG